MINLNWKIILDDMGWIISKIHAKAVKMNMEPSYRKVINSWCMYDWANSAFATTIMAAMFPPFFRQLCIKSGLSASTATAFWGYTAALALFIIAVTAPVLGAISDETGSKKRFLAFFAGLGIICTGCFVFIKEDMWIFAALLFIGGNIGFASGNTFYESLLPHVAVRNDIDQVSSKGYAIGYLGGGTLLIINVLWVIKPTWFLLPDSQAGLKLSFFSVAVWWLVFSIPLFKNVKEPFYISSRGADGRIFFSSMNRLRRTLKDIKKYKQLLLFLVAFWIYNDGIGTIIKMATAYGDEIGLNITEMIKALIMTQFVGIPFSILFGRLAGKIGTKQSILICLFVYMLISICGYFLKTVTQFYIMAFMVGTVQGGSQALSRSLYGMMVPKHKSAEFFGFFSTSSKFAGIIGPLLFGIFSQVFGNSRFSILFLVLFFLVGGILLSLVDVKQGIAVADQEESVI